MSKMGFGAKFEGSYIEVQALHELYHFILSINVEPTPCIPNVTFFIAYTIVNMRERNVFSRGWGIFNEILV